MSFLSLSIAWAAGATLVATWLEVAWHTAPFAPTGHVIHIGRAEE